MQITWNPHWFSLVGNNLIATKKKGSKKPVVEVKVTRDTALERKVRKLLGTGADGASECGKGWGRDGREEGSGWTRLSGWCKAALVDAINSERRPNC